MWPDRTTCTLWSVTEKVCQPCSNGQAGVNYQSPVRERHPPLLSLSYSRRYTRMQVKMDSFTLENHSLFSVFSVWLAIGIHLTSDCDPCWDTISWLRTTIPIFHQQPLLTPEQQRSATWQPVLERLRMLTPKLDLLAAILRGPTESPCPCSVTPAHCEWTFRQPLPHFQSHH